MTGSVLFDPILSLPVIAGFAVLAGVIVALAVWRGLRGWWLRALAAMVLLIALINPSLQNEDRDQLSDIVVLVVDESASQRLSDRTTQTDAAVAQVEAEIRAMDNTELRVVRFADAPNNGGSLAMAALNEVMSQVPRARIAGVLLVTDGQVHDVDLAPGLEAPFHTLLTGRNTDWDRRLIVSDAPAFAIIDEEVTMTLRIEDQGAVPTGVGDATLSISIDGGAPRTVQVPTGSDLEVPLTLTHGGINVVQLTVATEAGELTDRNNSAVLQVNGVRDRLRVLLVSGEPHAGERTWRNLLKSDSAVDLVHFTILRPPEKQDGVPVSELSLIAFPTRELFLEKVDEFDLIIFDRYKRRGILPNVYLDNITQYVRKGGAVLIAAGPDFAGAESLYRSPLAEVLPASPTARVYEEGYLPAITELGQRHPVTEGLDVAWSREGESWGRWFRLIELDPIRGHTVMSGAGDQPLLVLDRQEEGRVALLASDQPWLWSRGFEGGGPQLELLRRLAHWMMKEPELEEESLRAEADGQSVTIARRTLGDVAGDVQLTGPDGQVLSLTLEEVQPGDFRAEFDAPEIGLYHLKEGELEAVVGVGPTAPKEFEETIATGDKLAQLVDGTRGGIRRLQDGMPDIRKVRAGRVAAGRGWIGITPRQATVTVDVTLIPLAPAWAFLLLAAFLSVAAWLREGRR